MPGPTGMIVPMLQRLQLDMPETKQSVRSIDARIERLEEHFVAVGPYVTFTMGLHAQNRADVERHEDDIKEIKQRLDALETKIT